MKNPIIILSLLLITVIGIPASLCVAAADDGIYTYVFHINYADSVISQDSAYPTGYTLIVENYNDIKTAAVPSARGGGSYGQIIGIDGNILANFDFNLQKGANIIYAPYFPNAKTALLYSSGQTAPFQINLLGSAVCNEDKICNSAAGETALNCPSDCRIVPTSTSPQIPQNSQSSPIFYYIMLAIGLLILGTFAVFYFRKKNINN